MIEAALQVPVGDTVGRVCVCFSWVCAQEVRVYWVTWWVCLVCELRFVSFWLCWVLAAMQASLAVMIGAALVQVCGRLAAVASPRWTAQPSTLRREESSLDQGPALRLLHGQVGSNPWKTREVLSLIF